MQHDKPTAVEAKSGAALALLAELSKEFEQATAKVAENEDNQYNASVILRDNADYLDDEIRTVLAGRFDRRESVEDLSRRLRELFVRAAWQQEDILQFVHPATGLVVPPVARLEWKSRSNRYPSDIDAEAFLAAEYGEYCRHHLLYSDHLRTLDEPLHSALRRKAAAAGLSNDDYFLSIGVLTKRHTHEPPQGLEQQALFLRGVWMALYAQSMRKTAAMLLKP